MHELPDRTVFVVKPDADKPLPEWKGWLAEQLGQLAEQLFERGEEGSFWVRVEHPECPFDFAVEAHRTKEGE